MNRLDDKHRRMSWQLAMKTATWVSAASLTLPLLTFSARLCEGLSEALTEGARWCAALDVAMSSEEGAVSEAVIIPLHR